MDSSAVRQRFETQLAALVRKFDGHRAHYLSDAYPESQARPEREINVTDEQIDALVYELYGLTEEEIKVVEGGR